MLGLLTDLVARSLVVAERGGLDTRYRLLETIREYGEERLVEHDETDTLRDRHARYYARLRPALLRRTDSEPEQLAWGARMSADGENILAAFAHAVDTHDLDLAVRLLESTNLIADPDRLLADPSRRPVLAMTGVEQHRRLPGRAHGRRVRRRQHGAKRVSPGIRRRGARRGTGRDRPPSLHLDLSASRSHPRGIHRAVDGRVGRCRGGVPRSRRAPIGVRTRCSGR